LLAEKYGVASTVYSATSYQALRRDLLEADRWNRLHPDQPRKTTYVEQVLGNEKVPVIASSDYMRALPEQILPVLGERLLALGTDGFGRSDTRKALRRFFEIDAESVAVAALYKLAEFGRLDRAVVKDAIGKFGLDAEKAAPWTV
jgi:pyruvate dehydrogenase E1 component